MANHPIRYIDKDHERMRIYSEMHRAKKKELREKSRKNQPEYDFTTWLIASVKPTILNFRGNDEEQPQVCDYFGCSQHLSLEEKRFGNRCINHPKIKEKIEPSNYVSF